MTGKKVAFALFLGTLGPLGCGVDLGLLVPRPVGGGGSPTSTTVTIRFRNFSTTEAVDVEFFVSNDALENVPDDLFVEEHRRRASIGVAGTGIIQPLDGDAIELDCTENLVLGTSGGTFSDNESGEVQGQGARRWVQEGPLELCGSVITLDYRSTESGFTTLLSLDHAGN